MNKFKGKITKIIYKSDSNYMVILYKVLSNDLDESYNNKSIKATGTLYDIYEGMNIEISGNMTNHVKYGESFQILSYQEMIPDDKNSIISFLASDYFKGIGEAKATKLYDEFGDNLIRLIKEDNTILDHVDYLTIKNKNTIIDKLNEFGSSSDVIIKLNEIGFNIKDSNLIYKYYKENTLNLIDEDLYNPFYDIEKISFNKVDLIARQKYKKDDKRRVKAGIIASLLYLSLENGDTLSSLDDIVNMLKYVINLEIDSNIILDYLDELILDNLIYKEDNYYKLKRYYDADNNIVKRLTYLLNKEDMYYKEGYLDKLIEECESNYNIKYDINQKEAIKNAFLKNILVITGGPGTGKTTIIKSIVSIYKSIYKIDNVVLLAPTGRASKRIMESTLYKASTIHRFLKWNKDTNTFQVNEYNKSDAKCIIVDEVSMIDTTLFSSLLNALKYDTKIILVGDYNQLPSVQAGNILKDIIDTNLFPVIKLDRLYRQENGSNIISLAYDIQNEEINYKLFNSQDDLFFYQADSINLKEQLEIIINKYKDLDYKDYQVMAPIYKTLNGINNINLLMQDLINPKKYQNEITIGDFTYREGDKVLQLMNMPDDNIYNGDIGVIIEINSILKEVTIDFDSNIVTFNSSNFNNFTLGYCISIHKSQGSEFKTVIIPILKEYGRMLYKKLIYTGVTRAKDKLILVGEVDAFNYSITNIREDSRKTNLCKKIKDRYGIE